MEVLEMIADSIALNWDRRKPPVLWGWRDSRSMLAAFCRVCRALVPRCRLLLLAEVVLSSQKDVESMKISLRRHPYLIGRIRQLHIDAGGPDSQSWVSTVPLSLPIVSMHLEWLELYSVDLTQLHPTFYRMRFQKLKHIFFQNVRFTRYSQVIRLVHATQASMFRWDVPVITDEEDALRAAVDPRGPVLPPQCVDTLEWDMPWGLLEKMMQSFLQEASTSWPRFLNLRPHELPRNIPRTTYIAVLGLFMQIHERFYDGRQGHRLDFVSGSVRLNLDGE